MKKTTSTKNIYRYTSKEVADLVGCSESYVKQIRAGMIANLNTKKAQEVLMVDELLDDNSNLLLQEVSRILKGI